MRALAWLISSGAVLANLILAQSPPAKASIEGRVLDSGGKPLEKVRLTLSLAVNPVPGRPVPLPGQGVLDSAVIGNDGLPKALVSAHTDL